MEYVHFGDTRILQGGLYAKISSVRSAVSMQYRLMTDRHAAVANTALA